MRRYRLILLLVVLNNVIFATNVSTFNELQSALSISGNDIVNLNNNIVLSSDVSVNGSKVINFGTYKFTAGAYSVVINADATVTVTGNTGGITISGRGNNPCFKNYGELVIKGGQYLAAGYQVLTGFSGSHTIIQGGYFKCGAHSTKCRGLFLYDNASLEMSAGVVDGYYYGIMCSKDDINLKISGGTIQSAVSAAIYHPFNGSIEVSDSALISGPIGIQSVDNVTISGGNINSTTESAVQMSRGRLVVSDSAYISGVTGIELLGGTLEYLGGSISVSGIAFDFSAYSVSNDAYIYVNDGTFSSDANLIRLSTALRNRIKTEDGFVFGGNWQSDVIDYCSKGFITENIGGRYHVIHQIIPVAELNGNLYYAGGTSPLGVNYFTTVDEALQTVFNDAIDGDVITIKSNITIAHPIMINGEKTINFNGDTIRTTYNGYLCVNNESNVTFMGEGGIYASMLGLRVLGEATINSGFYQEFRSCTLSEFNAIRCEANAVLTINDGRVVSKNIGILMVDSSTVYINGGLIQGLTGLVLNNQYSNKQATCILNDGIINGYLSSLSDNDAVSISGNCISVPDETREAYPNVMIVNGGTIEGKGFYGSGILITGKGAELRMFDGEVKGNYYGVAGNGLNKARHKFNNGGTLISISGGSITVPSTRVALYQPQKGEIYLSGDVKIEGGAAVAMKSGKVQISDHALLHSTHAGRPVSASSNGIAISGAALQLETDTSYYGEMEVIIEEGAKLSSESWYAIYEYVENTDDPTQVKSISVEGGKFVGGILVSKSLVNKGGFVKGGTWSEDVEAHCVEGKTTIPLETTDPDYNPYYYRVVDQTVKEIRKPAIVVNDMANAAAIETKRTEMGRDTAILTNAADHIVVYKNADVVAVDGKSTVYAKKLTLKADTLFIRDGVTLNIGKGAIHIGDSVAPKVLIVEQGGTLVVDGLIYGAKDTTFMVHSSEAKSGVVLFSPETQFISEDHPEGTYRFTSKAFREAPTVVFQRFGMPVYNNEVTIRSLTADKGNSWYTWWDYNIKNWGIGEYFNNSISLTDVQPFAGYELSSNNVRTDTMQYDFIGKLMGNGNSALTYHKGWNYLANSYTGPISIAHYLNTVESEFPDKEVLASVYLYKDLGNDTYTWQAINAAVAGRTIWERVNGRMQQVTYPATIQPMQAFLMVNDVANSVYGSIIYEHDVYNPTLGISSTSAPTMRLADETKLMQLSVYNNEGWDNVFLSEDTRFSSGIDNGYDAYKCPQNSGLSLYAMQGGDRRMEILANSTLSDTYIGISAPRTGTYTLFMANVDGFDYAIQDMETGTFIDLGEKREYTFTALAGENDNRFRIVPIRSLPTAMDIVTSTMQIWVSDNTLFVSGNKGDDICVYSMGGQSVKQIAANGQSLQSVSLNDLATGVYMVRIADQTLSFIK